MTCYIGPPTWYLRLAGGQLTGNITFAGAQTVDGRDISAMVRAKIKTGTYVGDGSDDRNIDIGINLASKSNVYIIIKGSGLQPAIHRPEQGQGDLSLFFTGVVEQNDQIQAVTATGFQVGAGEPNDSGVLYRYIAIWEEP